jgi:hypothetical protein
VPSPKRDQLNFESKRVGLGTAIEIHFRDFSPLR